MLRAPLRSSAAGALMFSGNQHKIGRQYEQRDTEAIK